MLISVEEYELWLCCVTSPYTVCFWFLKNNNAKRELTCTIVTKFFSDLYETIAVSKPAGFNSAFMLTTLQFYMSPSFLFHLLC